ncbi:MAG: ABC transporter ATP-binding protein [Oscillospiraceae bacterium]|nr:ABC transporter ATP-binding protein [Oscillospiraceae bacterium]
MASRDFKKSSAFSIFASYYRPHIALFALDMFCALTIAAIDLAFPFVSRIAMYRLLPDYKWELFFVLMAAVAAAFALRGAMYYIVTYWGHTLGIRIEADIRADLFSHLEKLSFSFYDKNRTGQLMSRVTGDLFEITELAHHGPEDVFISLVTIIGALALMFSIQWKLALVVAAIVPVFILAVWFQRKNMMRTSVEVKRKLADINGDVESSLSGMRTAKAFSNEDVEMERFSASNERFKTAKRSFHKEMAKYNAVLEFFIPLLPAAVIAAGGALIMRGELNYIDLITFSLYVSAFVSPIRKIANFTELFMNGAAGLRRFIEVMRLDPDVEDAPDAHDLKNVRGDIDIENVSFAYRENLTVLHDITLHVKAGETVAVVGSSGGGKSTLCQLIPRFYDVSSGEIKIDGQNVRGLTQDSLRRNVGIVQQDVFLFPGTVAENIRYGKPDATDAEVESAAHLAEIYDDVAAMPDGFDTYVGERGTLLSGGQKQRISIARIFLKNPPILILDEATSSLDSVTEAKIQSAFDSLARGRTTLIIAHRLSTIHAADRIIVINDSTITEQGAHEELMRKNGEYAELYRTQMER